MAFCYETPIDDQSGCTRPRSWIGPYGTYSPWHLCTPGPGGVHAEESCCRQSRDGNDNNNRQRRYSDTSAGVVSQCASKRGSDLCEWSDQFNQFRSDCVRKYRIGLLHSLALATQIEWDGEQEEPGDERIRYSHH